MKNIFGAPCVPRTRALGSRLQERGGSKKTHQLETKGSIPHLRALHKASLWFSYQASFCVAMSRGIPLFSHGVVRGSFAARLDYVLVSLAATPVLTLASPYTSQMEFRFRPARSCFVLGRGVLLSLCASLHDAWLCPSAPTGLSQSRAQKQESTGPGFAVAPSCKSAVSLHNTSWPVAKSKRKNHCRSRSNHQHTLRALEHDLQARAVPMFKHGVSMKYRLHVEAAWVFVHAPICCWVFHLDVRVYLGASPPFGQPLNTSLTLIAAILAPAGTYLVKYGQFNEAYLERSYW